MAQSVFADHVRYVRGFDPHEKLVTTNYERADGTPFTRSLLPLAAREEWFLRDHPDGAIDRTRVEKDWQKGIVTAYACLVPDIRCPEVRYPEEEATVSLSIFERDFPGKPFPDLMGIAVNAAKSKAAGVALKKAGYRLDEETEVDEGEETAAGIEKADVSAIESGKQSSPLPGAGFAKPDKKSVRAEMKAAEAAKKQETIRRMAAAMSGREEGAPAGEDKAAVPAPPAEAKAVSPEESRPLTVPQAPEKGAKEAKPGRSAGKPERAAQEPSGAMKEAKPGKPAGKTEKAVQEPTGASNEAEPGRHSEKAERAAQAPSGASEEVKPDRSAEKTEEAALVPSEASKEAEPGRSSERAGETAQEPSGASKEDESGKSLEKAEGAVQEPSGASKEAEPDNSFGKAEKAAQEPPEALQEAMAGRPSEKPGEAVQEPQEGPQAPDAGEEAGPAAREAPAPGGSAQDEAALEARYRALVCAIDGRKLGDLLETESSQKYLVWAATRHKNEEVREGALWLIRKYSDDAHPALRTKAAQKGLLG